MISMIRSAAGCSLWRPKSMSFPVSPYLAARHLFSASRTSGYWRKVRLSRRSFHSFATIPWKMAAMHTTSSTRVHMSHTRNSSVGNL